MDRNSELVRGLVDVFKGIVAKSGTPDWAWRFKPPVPFVGRDYGEGKGLLVYGSAENLDDWAKSCDWFRDDEKAYVRRWYWYEHYLRTPEALLKNLFAVKGLHVGVEPFDSGGLLVAARAVCRERRLDTPDGPAAFLETLAVSNWCKFSIKRCDGKNRDYAGIVHKLRPSLQYVEEELRKLKPAIVIMPATTYKRATIRKAMTSACGCATQFVPLYQFSPRVLNGKVLKRFAQEGLRLKLETEGSDPVLADWMSMIGVNGAGKGSHWRYLAHVKSVLERCLR